jgi:hypothetical protein
MFEFCLSTTAATVPHSPEWLHEVKYGGYRLRVERDGDRVRLITRRGYDWAKRYPWIAEAARKVRRKRFVLDGEAVILSRFSNAVCWTLAGRRLVFVAERYPPGRRKMTHQRSFLSHRGANSVERYRNPTAEIVPLRRA